MRKPPNKLKPKHSRLPEKMKGDKKNRATGFYE